jgi:peroxiredoxin
MELEALQAALPEIQRLGASLVAISPQLERYGRSIHRRLNLGFDVLTDRGLQVASQFGLVFVLPDYLKTVYLHSKTSWMSSTAKTPTACPCPHDTSLTNRA